MGVEKSLIQGAYKAASADHRTSLAVSKMWTGIAKDISAFSEEQGDVYDKSVNSIVEDGRDLGKAEKDNIRNLIDGRNKFNFIWGGKKKKEEMLNQQREDALAVQEHVELTDALDILSNGGSEDLGTLSQEFLESPEWNSDQGGIKHLFNKETHHLV